MTSFPLRAVALGFIGAVLGSTLWVLIAIAANLEHSYPAILVGAFAGTVTRIEPQRDRRAQIAALAFTVIGMTIIQYFVVRHTIITDRIELGLSRSTGVFLDPAGMWRVTFGWLRIYPLNAVAWAVSATAAFLLPGGGEPALPQPEKTPA